MIWTGELVNSGDASHVTQTYPNRSLWGRERVSVLEAKGHLMVRMSGFIMGVMKGPVASLAQ